MRLRWIEAAPVVLVVAAVAGAAPVHAQKKGPNEAVLRQVEQASLEIAEGLQLLTQSSLHESAVPEARKLLNSAVNHTHRAGKALLAVGPTDSQRRAVGMVLQGTLRVEKALDLIDEARVTGRENAVQRLKDEKAAFKLARAERKAEMEAALVEKKAIKAAAALGLDLDGNPLVEDGAGASDDEQDARARIGAIRAELLAARSRMLRREAPTQRPPAGTAPAAHGQRNRPDGGD